MMFGIKKIKRLASECGLFFVCLIALQFVSSLWADDEQAPRLEYSSEFNPGKYYVGSVKVTGGKKIEVDVRCTFDPKNCFVFERDSGSGKTKLVAIFEGDKDPASYLRNLSGDWSHHGKPGDSKNLHPFVSKESYPSGLYRYWVKKKGKKDHLLYVWKDDYGEPAGFMPLRLRVSLVRGNFDTPLKEQLRERLYLDDEQICEYVHPYTFAGIGEIYFRMIKDGGDGNCDWKVFETLSLD